MKVSRILQAAAGVALAGVGLYIFFRKLDPSSLLKEIYRTGPWVIVAIAVVAMAGLWLRGLRWKILLPDNGQGHKRGLFPIVTVAFMINNILPLRLGEPARVLLLWKRNRYTIATSIGSLVLERVIDALAFSSFFFLPVLLVQRFRSIPFALPLAAASALLFLLVIGSFIAYCLFPVRFRQFASRVNLLLPKKIQGFGQKVGTELVSNLDWAFSPLKVLKVVLFSYLIAFSYSLMLILLAGNWGTFGVMEGLFGQAFAAFGAAIPLAPGFVGTLHAALMQGLTYIGIDREKAGAMVILYHAVPYLTVTAAGLFFLFSMNVTMRDITGADEQIRKSSLEEKADGDRDRSGSDDRAGVVRDSSGAQDGDQQESSGSDGGYR